MDTIFFVRELFDQFKVKKNHRTTVFLNGNVKTVSNCY